jgi:hypothetical protein
MKCGIYARYSCDLQRPASIEDQTRTCTGDAARKGWLIIPDFVCS